MCNCKKNIAQEKTTLTKNNIVVQVEEKKPVSKEELVQIMEAITSTNKTSETNKLIAEFNYKYFGEILSGYCDQNCIERTKTRILQLEKQLN